MRRLIRCFSRFVDPKLLQPQLRKISDPMEQAREQDALHEDEGEERYRKLSAEEVGLYSHIGDNYIFKLVVGVLKGHSISKMSRGDMEAILDHMVTMELGALPDDHLHYFIKWLGTSPARKFANRRCQNITLRLYSALSKRPLIHNMLLAPKHKSSQLFGGGSNELHSLTYKEMNSLNLKPAQVDQAFQCVFGSEKSLYMHFDLVVSFSNLNIFLNEYFDSLKFLLSHAVLTRPKEVPLHSLVFVKVTNIIWAIMKVAPNQDTEFYNLMISFYRDAIIQTQSLNRHFNLLWILSVEYLLSEGAPDPQVVQNIQAVLVAYTQLSKQQDRVIFNSKNSYLFCQTVLSLFPEIGPHFLANTLGKAQPSPHNPFSSHFNSLKETLVPSLWIIQQNMRCKQGETGINLTYVESDDRKLLTSRGSIFNNATHSMEKKVESVLIQVDQVHTLEKNVMVGFYEIDLMANNHIAINCDSIFHFIYGTRDKLSISLKIKEKHLHLLGIKKIVNLDYSVLNDNRGDVVTCVKQHLSKLLP